MVQKTLILGAMGAASTAYFTKFLEEVYIDHQRISHIDELVKEDSSFASAPLPRYCSIELEDPAQGIARCEGMVQVAASMTSIGILWGIGLLGILAYRNVRQLRKKK